MCLAVASLPCMDPLTSMSEATGPWARPEAAFKFGATSLGLISDKTWSLEGLSGEHSQLEAALEASQVHDLTAAHFVVLSSALYDSGCGHTQSPALL